MIATLEVFPSATAAPELVNLTKAQILYLYLNEIYYGNLAYGVEAASLSYFGKSAKDLNLAEASILSGLVQLPCSAANGGWR